MFDYPLPVPRHTVYQQLGLGPEATPLEIADAKAEILARLKKQKSLLDLDVDKVYAAIPGLKEARTELEKIATEGESPPHQTRRIQKDWARLKQEALKKFPQFREWRAKSSRLLKNSFLENS